MEWKTVKLGEVCKIFGRIGFRGYTNNDFVTKPEDGAITLSPTNIVDGELDLTKCAYINWNKYYESPEIMVQENDILLSKTGTIGRTALVKQVEHPMTINPQFVLLKECTINPRYLSYLLKTSKFQGDLYSITVGSVIATLSQKNLGNIKIHIVDSASQDKIVSVLSSLDAKIENNNRINRNLEAQAQALYKSWFVDFEPWGGKMPEDWKEGTLGDIVTVKRGGSPRPIQDYLSDKGYRWLKISDATAEASPFISHIVEHIKEEGLSKTVFIKQGSLVLSNSATPGLPKFVDLDTCIHDGWLYFPQSYFSNEYLYLLFQRERSYLLSQGNGSVFTNLKTDIVKNLSVTIPSEDVLNSFQQIVGGVFMEILNNQRESARLAVLRDTLLPKLMKGEIEV